MQSHSRTPVDSPRRERLDRWRFLPTDLLQNLPPDVLATIVAAVYHDGRYQLIRDRGNELKRQAQHRLPETLSPVFTLVVVLVGAIGLSLVPYTLARQSGRTGPLAISIGFVGGAAASFFGHAAASQYLAGRALKASTQQARQSIREQL